MNSIVIAQRKIMESLIFLLFCFVFFTRPLAAFSLTGPIMSSSAVVNGSVTVSSMTVSTLTVSNLLKIQGVIVGEQGRTLQVSSFATTGQVTVSTTNFYGTGIQKSITLSNSSNYVRISLSGLLQSNLGSFPVYLTIYRDSVNLGDSSLGLSSAQSIPGIAAINGGATSVGITIKDSPGDTAVHVYQVYMRVRAGDIGSAAHFPYRSTAYLLLEEIGK